MTTKTESVERAFCCEYSWAAAKVLAWKARDLTCGCCDHNEYCERCYPTDFRPGGKWDKYRAAPEPLTQRVAELEAALRELVACKDLKNRIAALNEKTYFTGGKEIVAEYERRKSPAWVAARAVLAAAQEQPK